LALIWGRHPIIEALRSGRPIEKLYLSEGTRPTEIVAEIIQLARNRGIAPQYLDRRALDRLSDGANHQGVVAEVEDFRYHSLDDLIAVGQSRPTLPLILALDALEDPQNFGTLIRSADAAGVTGILIPAHRAVGVTPAVEKASAGAIEHVPIARVTNLARALTTLKEHDYWAAGLDEAGGEAYDRFRVDVPLVLVVGAEGKGLGRLVRETCDVLVRLPMRGKVSSLNAAVAGSIVLFEIERRRLTSDS
jgi:23S rRNA (guanosine2251-2'-O)-methyltransferase